MINLGNKSISYFCLAFFLLNALVPMMAQDDLEQEEVQIIKNFEAQLLESERLDLKASLPQVDNNNRMVQYDVPSKVLNIDYKTPQLKPIAMNSQEVSKIFHTYLKAGYGTPNAILAELSHHQKIDENLDLTGQFRFHRANNKNLEHQKNSNAHFDLQSNYTAGTDALLSSNLFYHEDTDHYYGYDHDLFQFTEEEAKQRFRTFGIASEYSNVISGSFGLNYGIGINYSRRGDVFSNKENAFIIDGNLQKNIADKHPLRLELIADLTRYEMDDESFASQNLNNFNIKPSFTFHANKFRVDVGSNLYFLKDDFRALPFVEAAANVVSQQLVAFAGYQSYVQKNTFHSLTDFNPYLDPNLEIFNSVNQDIYGGLKGKIRSLDYVAKVGYKTIDQLPLYVNDQNDLPRFNVVTDSVSIFYLEGIVDFQILENLSFQGSLSQKIYNLENEERAWHLPALELDLSLNYKMLEDKLLLEASFFGANPIPYLNENGVRDRLNALVDFNLGASYEFNENFSFFVDGNNLVNNKRERWFMYDGFGINVLGGVSVKF